MPGGSSAGPPRRRCPGSTVGRRRRRSASAWASGSPSASRSASGVSVGVGVGVVGVGVSSRLALAVVGDLAVEVLEPVAQVALQRAVGLARQRVELLLGLAHGALRRVAVAGLGGAPRVGDERGELSASCWGISASSCEPQPASRSALSPAAMSRERSGIAHPG